MDLQPYAANRPLDLHRYSEKPFPADPKHQALGRGAPAQNLQPVAADADPTTASATWSNNHYTVNGNYLQVMLPPRELSYADLPNKSWINERLVFTHGFGLAMGPVSGITKEGCLSFTSRTFRRSLVLAPKVTRPEIYYGETPNDYVIVNAKTKEFSYPTTGENVSLLLTGRGGVRLSYLFLNDFYMRHISETTEIVLFGAT